MNIVLNHIEYLLSKHDCVVVPNFGAFLASWQSAEYDDVNGTLTSPHRQYSFNESLNTSDGLLVVSLSRTLSVDYDRASRIIQETVDAIRFELDNLGEFTFGRIGRIERKDSDLLEFHAFKEDRITPLANWIEPVEVQMASAAGKRTSKNDSSNRRRHKIKVRYDDYERRHNRVERYLRNFAGAVAAIFIALIVSTPVAVKNTYLASTAPVVRMPKSVEVKQEISTTTAKEVKVAISHEVAPVESQKSDAKQEAVAQTQKNDISPEQNVKTTPEPAKTEIRFNDDDEYVLIVASLPSLADAQTFVNQYSNVVRLGITPASGNYRIYAATGSSGKEAMQSAKCPAIASNFKNVWATRR